MLAAGLGLHERCFAVRHFSLIAEWRRNCAAAGGELESRTTLHATLASLCCSDCMVQQASASRCSALVRLCRLDILCWDRGVESSRCNCSSHAVSIVLLFTTQVVTKGHRCWEMRCARLGGASTSRRLFVKTFWKSQSPLVPSATRPGSKDTHACFSNHRAPSPLSRRSQLRGRHFVCWVFSLTKTVDKACSKPLRFVDRSHAIADILCAFVPAAGQWSVNTCSMLCAQMQK